MKLKEAIAKMEREAQESGDLSKATLSSLGLPAALEAEEGDQGVSDELWGQVQLVCHKGGRDALEAQISRIDIAVREAKSAVASIVEDLQKEKAEDDGMRAQFGSRWNRRSSDQLAAQFHRDLDIISKYLAEADKSNAKVRAELERNAAVLDALHQTRQQIDARMPHNTQVAAQSSQAKRDAGARLHTLLDSLSALLDERAAVLQEAQAASAKHDLVPILSANLGKAKSIEVIHSEELAAYDPYRQRLTELTQRQDALLNDIKGTMATYESSSRQKSSSSLSQRQAVLQELNDAIRVFDRLQANLNEGIRFYSDLQTQRIAPLKQRVEDFALARKMESQMVLSQLTQDIASYKDDDRAHRGSFGSPTASTGGGGGTGGSRHPVNPNLAYEHPDQPMYDFPAPSSASSSPRGLAAPSSATNPFAEYAAGPPASYQQAPQPQYPPYHPQASSSPQRYQPLPRPQPPPQQTQQQPQAYQSYQPHPSASSSSYPGQHHAAAPPPPPQQSAGIQCPACTFENPATATVCEICATTLSKGAGAGQQAPMMGGTAGVPMPQRSIFGSFR